MIFRPVTPASPIGPPTTNLPEGFTKIRPAAPSYPCSSSTGRMTSRVISGVITSGREMPSSCCVETTTVSMPTGFPSS